MPPEAAELGRIGCDVEHDNSVMSTNSDSFVNQLVSSSKLPSPITVTVVVRVPEGEDVDMQGDEVSQRSACRRDRFVAGKVRGIFHPELYLISQDCITYKGKRISRSKFERLGNSSMAKWHRSIRVIHEDETLEPLGEWLARHGLPVLKGKQRTSRRRPHPKPPSMAAGFLPAVAAAQMRLAVAVRDGWTAVGGLNVPTMSPETPARDQSLLSTGTAADGSALTALSAVHPAVMKMEAPSMTALLSDVLLGRPAYNRADSYSSRDSSLKGEERRLGAGSDGGEDEGDGNMHYDWATGYSSGLCNGTIGDYLAKVTSSGVGALADEASPACAATPIAATPITPATGQLTLGAAQADAHPGTWSKAGWGYASPSHLYGQSCSNNTFSTDAPSLAAAAPAPFLDPATSCTPNPRPFLQPTCIDGMASPHPSSRTFDATPPVMPGPTGSGCADMLASMYLKSDPAAMAAGEAALGFASAAPAQAGTAAVSAPSNNPNPLDLMSDSAIWYDEKTTTECVLALFGGSEEVPNDDAAAVMAMAMPNAAIGALHSATAIETVASSMGTHPSLKQSLNVSTEAHGVSITENAVPELYGAASVSQCRPTPFAAATPNMGGCQQPAAAAESSPSHLAPNAVARVPVVSGEANWVGSYAATTPELQPVDDTNRLQSMPSPPSGSTFYGSLHGWPFVPQLAGGNVDHLAFAATTPVGNEDANGNNNIHHAMPTLKCISQEHLSCPPAATLQAGAVNLYQPVAHENSSWAAKAPSEPQSGHFAVASSSGLDSCPPQLGDVATATAPNSCAGGQLPVVLQAPPSSFMPEGYSYMSLSQLSQASATDARSSIEESAGYGPPGVCRSLPPSGLATASCSAVLPVNGPARRPHYRVAYAPYPHPPYYLPYYPPPPGYARMRVPAHANSQVPGVLAEGAVWPAASWPARLPPPPHMAAPLAPPPGAVHYWRRRAPCLRGANAAYMLGYPNTAGWTLGASQASHLQQYLQSHQLPDIEQRQQQQQQQQEFMMAADSAPGQAMEALSPVIMMDGAGALVAWNQPWNQAPVGNSGYTVAPWDNAGSSAVQVAAAGGLAHACGVSQMAPAATFMSHMARCDERSTGDVMSVRTAEGAEGSGASAFGGPSLSMEGWGVGQDGLPMASVARPSSVHWANTSY